MFPAFLFLPLFLNENHVCPQSVPLPQVPMLATAQSSSAPRPVGSKPWSQLLLFFRWYFFICLVPHLHSSVTGFRILWVYFPFPTAVVAQSLSLSKVCDFKQLLLISVSHWCGSFLYCKETYLRLLIAVSFSVFPQTPSCCGASSSGGRGRCCHRSNGQRCMS